MAVVWACVIDVTACNCLYDWLWLEVCVPQRTSELLCGQSCLHPLHLGAWHTVLHYLHQLQLFKSMIGSLFCYLLWWSALSSQLYSSILVLLYSLMLPFEAVSFFFCSAMVTLWLPASPAPPQTACFGIRIPACCSCYLLT